MPTVLYQMPYAFAAIFGRSSKPQTLRVSDTIMVVIAEASVDEAPIIASADMPWPTSRLPGQGEHIHFEGDLPVNSNHINPTAKIRFFNDGYYVPVMKFSTVEAIAPVNATLDDLQKRETNVHLLATPFERVYGELEPYKVEMLKSDAEGDLPRLVDVKIKRITDPSDRRAEAHAAAVRDANQYLSVDGGLWRRLPGEPCIRYTVKYPNIVTLDIVPHILGYPSGSGYFQLARLEDCLEHIAESYPGQTINHRFENLMVAPGHPFTFADEEQALLALFGEVISALEKQERQMSALVQTAYMQLKDLRFGGKSDDHLDQVAKGIASIAQMTRDDYELPMALDAGLTRWDMRPVDAPHLISVPGI